jgi:hypothetical protein
MILAVEFGEEVTPHEVQQRAFELIALWRRPVRIVFGSGDSLSFDENGGSVAKRGKRGAAPSPRNGQRRAT